MHCKCNTIYMCIKNISETRLACVSIQVRIPINLYNVQRCKNRILDTGHVDLKKICGDLYLRDFNTIMLRKETKTYCLNLENLVLCYNMNLQKTCSE